MIGLDCAAPALVFDRLRPHLPAIGSLMARGTYGTLRSTTPPITVPAWACMTSGRDPGELGIYGFRNRIEGSRALRVVTADDVRAPRVWDVAGEHGKSSSVLYVPPTFPPRPIRGELVSCMLTPGPDAPHTHPPELAAELSRFGPHAPDVDREGDASETIEAILDAARQHFDVAEHLLATRKPDLMMMVELGTDRLHHAAWPALDPSDPRHDPRSPLVRDARDVYAYLDARIARMLDRAGPDATVMVVSDHGARPLRGGLRINEWLRREGWLVLRSEPTAPVSIERADVDWSRTRAWAEGGYFARVVINAQGRFPDGSVAAGDLSGEIARLSEALAAMTDDRGASLGNRVVRPREAYAETNGTPPDLMLFAGDLDLRCLGEVGGDRAVLVGPEQAGVAGRNDGCNHDWDGMYVIAGPEVPRAGRRDGAAIHDVGATMLHALGIKPPRGWRGADLRDPHVRGRA